MTASSPHPSVLIVDDSPGVLLSMHRLLSPHVSVQMASSARAALEVLTPDTALVLSDVQMPGMNGLELARQLREGHPQLAVVLMSGVVEENLRLQARELGVLDVMRKPLRSEELLASLRGWLSGGLEDAHNDVPETGPNDLMPSTPVLQPPELTFQEAQAYVSGINLLPGVLSSCVFGEQGELIAGSAQLPAQLGAYLGFLSSTSASLSTHLGGTLPMQAVQIEFGDRVLVVCPFGTGILTAVVHDTPAASGVKSWMRTRAIGPGQRSLH
ncbi:response regulator [Deinococcus humi]|uniref:CheY-like chemotaxis protein n=1 Tax=Deinococcus humi TaxID=662880 RepID=A0A7W8NGU5_9DEIO|nr:response regulator [Deinococcus humi]MBB5365145.1 CheY-like chemotaxis protein [Deinococcus humi]